MELYYNNKETREIKGEVFKPYPLNTQYLASNLGRIKSKQQIVAHNLRGKAIKKERILTQTDNGSGYLSVGLTENGKTKTTRVSRIIAQTWIPNPENKLQVNHKKGIKYDNRANELEWNTCGENVRHAWDNGLANKQSSFLYVQERLKQINNYITNRPRVKTPLGCGTIIIDQNCYRIEYDNGKFENLVKSLRFWKDDFKLILLNLDLLTKEIEVNGEKFVPIVELAKLALSVKVLIKPIVDNQFLKVTFEGHNEDYSLLINKGIDFCLSNVSIGRQHNVRISNQLQLFEKLYEWHFDIHGLIEKGLAIDINTLDNGIQ